MTVYLRNGHTIANTRFSFMKETSLFSEFEAMPNRDVVDMAIPYIQIGGESFVVEQFSTRGRTEQLPRLLFQHLDRRVEA